MTVPGEQVSQPDSERAPVPDAPRHHGLGVIVLAAGEGTRMRSARPKVLHGFAGRSMLGHVLAAVAPLHAEVTAVVVGSGRELVQPHLELIQPDAVAIVQAEQRGTGHAVAVALDQLSAQLDTILVLPGDAPLLQARTLIDLLDEHVRTGAAATLLTSRVPDPTGYGRVLRDADGAVTRVVEHRDATAAEQEINEVSALVYAFDAAVLRDGVSRLSTDNAQGEQYLPDVIGWLRAGAREVRALLAPAVETAGVNDLVQLSTAYRAYNERLLVRHMLAGVTVLDPATTWIDADVEIEADVVLLSGVHLGAGSRIARDAVIGPDCTLRATTVGAATTVARSVTDTVTIGAHCTVGPFAYLRGEAVLADTVKVGTFVEVKNSTIGPHSKVPHLSYVGDASIGTRTNIGASTVFANYDGVTKNRSEVGDDVRIGCDTTLVAPVRIGDGAYTGAGTVVRADVPADALAVSMGPQRQIDNWARTRRGARAGRLDRGTDGHGDSDGVAGDVDGTPSSSSDPSDRVEEQA